ncbi:MAG: LpxL/LpxP family Kdo(2)-lipid IV(A) lauroyl/palmitoleoyl acyltransferase [Gammaproteobacteria bacterium]
MNSRAEIDAAPDAPDLIPLYRFWQPRYWGLWLTIVVLRLVVLLPFGWQMRIGQGIGRLAMLLLPKRRKIVIVNLRLCFPELDDAAIGALTREHFESLGIGIVEVGLSWWISVRRARELVNLDGFEHVQQALDKGENIILLSGHFSGAEVVGVAIRELFPDLAGMYRPANNPLADQIIRRGRQRGVYHLIPKESLRRMIRLIKGGAPVWYASDQAYDRKYSALVPFFGVPAMTNCALTHIARMTNAVVIPFVPRRRADLSGYDAVMLPPLENFPTDDAAADALRVHHLLEAEIRAAPAQYYWVHRRFKNRPPPHEDVYANAS